MGGVGGLGGATCGEEMLGGWIVVVRQRVVDRVVSSYE